jgi:AbrB family looped-hinge helix DNA binding protein
MAEIVEVDKSGRIVIPKKIRDDLGIREKTQLMIMKSDGKLMVIPFSLDELVHRLEVELDGVEVEEMAASIRREINAKIAEEHPELSAR